MDRKEAIEVIKKNWPDNSFTRLREALETLIPELMGSKDEKIKKQIIYAIKELPVCDETKRECIDWLEKQGEQSFSNTRQECLKGIKRVRECQDLSDWEKKFDNIASLYAFNKNQEGYNEPWYVKERAAEMLYHAKKELEKQVEQKPIEDINGEDYGIDGLWHAQRILERTLGEVEGYQSDDGILEHKCAITAVRDLAKKQGEQNHKFRIGDTIKKVSTGDIVTISEIDLKNREYRLSNTGFIPFKYEHLWELVEQKSADKVEPKFKAGDIVKSKSQPMLSPRKIISIGKDCYWCEDRGCIGFAWEDDYDIVEQKPVDKVESKFYEGD